MRWNKYGVKYKPYTEYYLKGNRTLRIDDVNDKEEVHASLYIKKKSEIIDVITYDYVDESTIDSILEGSYNNGRY